MTGWFRGCERGAALKLLPVRRVVDGEIRRLGQQPPQALVGDAEALATELSGQGHLAKPVAVPHGLGEDACGCRDELGVPAPVLARVSIPLVSPLTGLLRCPGAWGGRSQCQAGPACADRLPVSCVPVQFGCGGSAAPRRDGRYRQACHASPTRRPAARRPGPE